MTTGINDKDASKLPNLSLDQETINFLFLVVDGYTPYPRITEMLASGTGGFFSAEYTVE